MPTGRDYEQVVERIWKPIPTKQMLNVWPSHAMSYVRAFWKAETGRKFPWKIRIGSGNRNTWLASGVFTVNPDQGWHDINHDMSHFIERRVTGAAHSDSHLRRERNGAHLIVRRFLETEKPLKKEVIDKVAVRASRVDAGIKRWDAKLKRAANALKKLKRKKRYYDKVLVERSAQ